MKDDYMMSNKVRGDVDLRALNETPTTTHNIMDLIPTIPVSSTSVPHYNRKVVIQADLFMYLEEYFKAILEIMRLIPHIMIK